MNLYLDPPGFLGTGASLLADLTLIAYVLLLIPLMLIGFFYARRGKHRPHHRTMMVLVTVMNWVLIIFLMVVAYRFDVSDNIGQQPGNLRYLLPTVHGVLGLPAQLLATFIVIRMAIEDRTVAVAKKRGETNLSVYWWKSAKPFMQITLALWLATALLGIGNYLIRYDVIPSSTFGSPGMPEATEAPLAFEATDEATPVTTPEVTVTEDAAPVMTPEVAVTEDLMPASPVGTEEAGEPAETPESGS